MKPTTCLLIFSAAAVIFSSCTTTTDTSEKTSSVSPNSVSEPEPETKDPSSIEESKPQDVVAGVGDTIDYGGLTFTLDSASTYVDSSDFPMDTPDEGNIFIVLNFTVGNETGKDEHINMFFEDSYCDDTAIDPEIMMVNVKGETVWGDVANGKQRKGYIAYQVPSEWKTLEFYYKPELLGDDSSKMIFKVTPEDLSE